MSNPATSEQPRRKSGRPALPVELATEPVTVRLPRIDLARLDDWRRRQGDLPTRPEGIRRLLALGFSAMTEAASRGAAA